MNASARPTVLLLALCAMVTPCRAQTILQAGAAGREKRGYGLRRRRQLSEGKHQAGQLYPRQRHVRRAAACRQMRTEVRREIAHAPWGQLAFAFGACTIGGLALSASTWKPATRL